MTIYKWFTMDATVVRVHHVHEHEGIGPIDAEKQTANGYEH